MGYNMDVDTASVASVASNAPSAASTAHPRRRPAHESVSLVHKRPESRARTHSPDAAAVSQPNNSEARPSTSPSSLEALPGKNSSGESSNAEKWFEKSNNHATGTSPSFADDSPPFFLQNSSSEETPSQLNPESRGQMYLQVPSADDLPLRAGLLQLGTDNSSTEDYRSVIDDLTIENKRLKRKLKSYQKLQDSRLKDQKLFEIRVHGLPTTKKRELEEMLKKFALGLGGPPGVDSAHPFFAAAPHLPPPLDHNKSGSSSASNLNADSAYASASLSGQGSSAQSSSNSRRKTAAAKSRQQHNSIQSFLHDIPEGLLPRPSAAMTEKAKRKLVVRRLEQIFAGKGAVSGSQHAGQQQEVSQLAASMDRNTYFETEGHQPPKEGIREASILSEKADQDLINRPVEEQPIKGKAIVGIKSKSLEQRPTRPLDLDPYRAQVPVENMQYIRHLGFSPPVHITEPPQDGHGWIYLNLLANMAQLHTINVTTDFVRRAVQEYSTKFELSSDGRKVRWKGGRSITRHSSSGDDSPLVDASGNMSSDRSSPRKKLKISQQDSESGSKLSNSLLYPQDNKFAYTPLFYQRSSNGDSSLSSDEEDEDTNESSFPPAQTGDSSGMTSSGIKTSSTKLNKSRETGPIIFYNNAKFCTDLSGEVKTEDALTYNTFLYHSIGRQAVGLAESSCASSSGSADLGPLQASAELPDAMDLDDNPIPAQDELHFPESSPMSPQSKKSDNKVEFEVSGLGGVCPADNFTIDVQSMHASVDDKSAPMSQCHPMPSRYPQKIASILEEDGNSTQRKARIAFHKKVVVARREELPPSRLPDASRLILAGDVTPEDDDDEDEDSDVEDIRSPGPLSLDDSPPSVAPQKIDMNYLSSDDEEDSDEDDVDDDTESDGSVDMLATARKIDPEAIRQKEREYDAAVAERLAEEIPAGSSAATAGGGSGFASPASHVDLKDWEKAKRSANKARELRKSADSEKRETTKRRRDELDA
ncbi:hypothetical protein ANO11243_046040 [Dothideomycetidae sp. 11243]|nr:hypothetical protein ANO11243_046040 [fungal sp. No.11243]